MKKQTVDEFLTMIREEYNNDFTLWFTENESALPGALEQFNTVPLVWLSLNRAYEDWKSMNNNLSKVRALMDGNHTVTSVLPSITVN